MRTNYILTQRFIPIAGIVCAIGHPLFFLLCAYIFGYVEAPWLRLLAASAALPLVAYPRRSPLSLLQRCYWEACLAASTLTVLLYLAILNGFNTYWFCSVVFAGLFYGLCASRSLIPIMVPLSTGLAVGLAGMQDLLPIRWRISLFEVAAVSLLGMSIAIALRWSFDRLYAQLLDAHAQLEKSEQQRSTFFQNVSHELRTPLTLIAGPIDAALDDQYGKVDAELREQLFGIKRNSRRLMQLINQLLELSKLDAGAVQLDRQKTDLRLFLRPIVAAYESAAARRDMRITLTVPDSPCVADIDRDRMEIVINNLLSNAFKFTERGGKIRVELSYEDSKALFCVRDTGCGIPPDKLAIIFDRFAQADTSTTRRYEGTGIGLSLVKEIVELHNGTVSVTSEPGFGTAFVLTLPALRDIDVGEESSYEAGPITLAHAVYEPALSVEGHHASQRPDAGQGHVLVVEDNLDMQRFIAKSLTHAGFSVQVASDGEAGLHAAQLEPPDLIVTDVMMPRMDGMELLRRCRSSETLSRVPFIVLTAKAGDETLLAALRGGADDYVTKPFSVEELTARAERLVQLRRVCGENEDLKAELRRVSQHRIGQIASGCPMIAPDLHVLQSLFGVDIPSALNKIRYLTEKLLHTLCTTSGTTCGGEPTVERMIGPLTASGVLPKAIAIHVRTIQGNTSPGSHFQPSMLSEAHALIAEQALIELIDWFMATYPHSEPRIE